MTPRPGRFTICSCVVIVAVVSLCLVSCTISRPLGKSGFWPAHPKPAVKPAAAPAAPKSDAPAAAKPASAAETKSPPAAPAPSTAPASQSPAAKGALEVSVQSAVLMALENNQELVVQKLQPQIVKTGVDEARARFDPILFGSVGWEREQGELVRGLGTQNSFITDTWVEEVGVKKLFPTGTTIGFGATTEMADKARQRQLVQSRLGLTVTQALLRGFGPEVNLAAVRQAKLDTISSEYELRGFALMLVADVEATYWDYVLHTHEIEVLEQSVRMAEEQLKNIQERVKAGTAPQMELSAAEAEIALRRQDVVEAQSKQGKALVHLRRLLNLPGGDPWTRELRLLDRLSAPAAPVDDVELHAQLAMRMRPEINATKLGIERGDLQIVRTRNGLLPKLDLFLTVGKSGYAQSFGNAWKNIGGDEHDLLVGVSAEYPAGNHEARGRYQRAVLTRRAADESVKNLEQIVQEEVRTAYLEARRAKEQIAASADTRKLDEAKLRVEAERFMLGRATSFQVARAQRDLAKSRVAEVRAAAEYQMALVELYRADGSLLERRGVSAPGRDPPKGATASR